MLLRVLVIFVHICLSQELYVIVKPEILFPSLAIDYNNDYDNEAILRNNYAPYPIQTYEDDSELAESPKLIKILQKRSAPDANKLLDGDSVCEAKIHYDHAPTEGFGKFLGQNQSYEVEIQQDSERRLVTNFVECTLPNSSEQVATGSAFKECKAIDKTQHTSGCITTYVFRPAGIRLKGSTGPFQDGTVKVPVMCQCLTVRKTSQP